MAYKSYDITIGHNPSLEVVLKNTKHSHDIYIYNLLKQQSLYSHDLGALMFHLEENVVQCILNTNLFWKTRLCCYDDALLKNLDDFPLLLLEDGVALDVVSPIKLATVMTENFVLCYGLEHYSNQYLYNYDDYTLQNMEAEF